MTQSSAAYFSHAFSGSLNDTQIDQYKQYLESTSSQFTGWLGEQAKTISSNFTEFFNSKAWEFSKRLLKKNDGEYVSSFEIGYLGTVNGLENATGLMRDYIMAHQDVMQLYLDEAIDPYEGGVSPWCTGLREDNFFWRQSMSGVLTTKEVDNKTVLSHTHYRESLRGELSFREKVDVHKTWNAISHHIANKALFNTTTKDTEQE